MTRLAEACGPSPPFVIAPAATFPVPPIDAPSEAPLPTLTIVTSPSAHATQDAVCQTTIVARATASPLPTREDERRRLRRVVHDGPIQELLVIGHRLVTPGTEMQGRAAELAELHRAVIAQVHTLRQLYAQLLSGVLDELGLCKAVRVPAIECERARSCVVALDAQGDLDRLSDEAAVTLFRAAQEAPANVARHGSAGTFN